MGEITTAMVDYKKFQAEQARDLQTFLSGQALLQEIFIAEQSKTSEKAAIWSACAAVASAIAALAMVYLATPAS